jgi:hypothetical protein
MRESGWSWQTESNWTFHNVISNVNKGGPRMSYFEHEKEDFAWPLEQYPRGPVGTDRDIRIDSFSTEYMEAL